MVSVRSRNLLVSLVVTGLLVVAPSLGQAQQKWDVQGRAGVAVPAGDLADIADLGPSFGLGVAYWFHPRIAVRADGDVDILSGAELAAGVDAPDLTLWHYNGGVEFAVTQPAMSRWQVNANVGAGATTFDSDAENGGAFSDTEFSLNGGLKVGYEVTPSLVLFAGGQAYLMFTEEETWVFPVTAGLKYGVPGR